MVRIPVGSRVMLCHPGTGHVSVTGWTVLRYTRRSTAGRVVMRNITTGTTHAMEEWQLTQFIEAGYLRAQLVPMEGARLHLRAVV